LTLTPLIQAVVYDFGNVLVDIDFRRVTDTWARHAGMDPDALHRRFHHGPAYQAYERNEIDAAGYFESLRREGLVLTDEQFTEGWNAVMGEEIAPTVALVKRLAPRIPQYLLSNTNRVHFDYAAKRYAEALAPLRRLFLSHEMRLRKPERAIFDQVAREIGVEPARILYFDDLAENVEGARAAGMDAVLVGNHDDVSSAVESRLGILPDAS
jgi:putative hydrolase of the HAD superfamily